MVYESLGIYINQDVNSAIREELGIAYAPFGSYSEFRIFTEQNHFVAGCIVNSRDAHATASLIKILIDTIRQEGIDDKRIKTLKQLLNTVSENLMKENSHIMDALIISRDDELQYFRQSMDLPQVIEKISTRKINQLAKKVLSKDKAILITITPY